MIAKDRKKRAESIREIRKLAKILIDQDERDKNIDKERKKKIKLVFDNEKSKEN